MNAKVIAVEGAFYKRVLTRSVFTCLFCMYPYGIWTVKKGKLRGHSGKLEPHQRDILQLCVDF